MGGNYGSGLSNWGGSWNTDDDSQAYEDYYDELELAGEDRVDDRKAAEVTYVTAIGDAQIARATGLGTAEVSLATARADAAIAFRTASQSAETAYATLELAAVNTRRGVVLPAELAYTITVAAGRQAKAANDEDSNVGLVNLEGSAAVVAATSRATAEATYHYAGALVRADQLENLADSLDTPQANFDALAADVYADWLIDVGPAFIIRATAKAYADGLQAYNLAVAWRIRNNAREGANYSFTVNTATLSAGRAANEASFHMAYGTAAETAENARNSFNLLNKRTLEIAVATAQKTHAISAATAEKQYQLDRLEHYHESESYGSWYGGTWYGYGWYAGDAESWHDREVALADADVARVTSIEDAKLTYQKDEATARKDYSQSLAGMEKTHALGLAAIARDAVVAEAGYQQSVDAVFASSEETYWTAETNATNGHRTGVALAEVNYWGADEAARVTAADSIDSTLDSPWSEFLVVQSTAHATWWTGAAANYLSWIADRNATENTWQTTINTAHAEQALNYRTTKADLAATSANAAKTRDDSLATMRQAYMSFLATPAKGYVDAVAQAERNYPIAVAAAQRTRVEDNDWDAYYEALEDAADAKANAITSAKTRTPHLRRMPWQRG